MPRTTTLETPGCPPLRALSFDALGLIKVIQAKGEEKGAPKVVERWGEPDASRAVVAASIVDRELDPLLGVARKNGSIDILSPVSGDIQVSVANLSQTEVGPEGNAIVGMHLFKKQRLQSSSPRSCTFLTCNIKGHASMRSIELPESQVDAVSDATVTTWNASGSGEILFSKVDESECYALFGGKGVEVSMWDIHQKAKLWTAKSPVKNNLGIFSPTWFTSASFLSKGDRQKFVCGTNSHQVRLYDTCTQRRPVMSFDFRENPIKAVSADLDGYTIYIGNGSGDLASVDIRTGKLLGCFLGKCAGSIRSIVRHPELPVIASCGLDSYLRFWDIKSRQLLSAVFLKQHLTDVVFDSYFRNEEVAGSTTGLPPQAQGLNEVKAETEEDIVLPKRKKMSKLHKGSKKHKSKKAGKNIDLSSESREFDETLDATEENLVPAKRKKVPKLNKGSEKLKSRKTDQ